MQFNDFGDEQDGQDNENTEEKETDQENRLTHATRVSTIDGSVMSRGKWRSSLDYSKWDKVKLDDPATLVSWLPSVYTKCNRDQKKLKVIYFWTKRN